MINLFHHKELERFGIEVFQKIGFSKENAEIITKSLVLANLRGVDSHGVIRIKYYTEGVEKGLINPFDFISIAEETGLIIPIGQWVFEEACRQTKLWHQQGYDELIVSVNVSAKQFHQQSFMSDICSAIEAAGIDPNRVDLEITESCTMNNVDSAISVLNGFRELGLLISLDDFGTGFSSLSLLNQLPLDILKIDIVNRKSIYQK